MGTFPHICASPDCVIRNAGQYGTAHRVSGHVYDIGSICVFKGSAKQWYVDKAPVQCALHVRMDDKWPAVYVLRVVILYIKRQFNFF